jgi:hypothetical protein
LTKTSNFFWYEGGYAEDVVHKEMSVRNLLHKLVPSVNFAYPNIISRGADFVKESISSIVKLSSGLDKEI